MCMYVRIGIQSSYVGQLYKFLEQFSDNSDMNTNTSNTNGGRSGSGDEPLNC